MHLREMHDGASATKAGASLAWCYISKMTCRSISIIMIFYSRILSLL